MSNEIEIDMPTYTCEKCARTFSQKSHYTAHQNKKFDCSVQTNISVAKEIIEKEELKEMNEKYFDAKEYKLYEITDFLSYAFDITYKNIVNAMAYMSLRNLECYEGCYEGFIFYTNFQQGSKYNVCEGDNRLYYDILILEPGITLIIYDVYNNKYEFTEKDIKYFPLLQVDIYKNRVEILSENPVKIISFTNDVRRKIMQTKFYSNNSIIEFNKERYSYILNIKLPLFSNFVENLRLTEMKEMSEIMKMNETLIFSWSDKYDGFSDVISNISDISDTLINPFNNTIDIIVLNEFVTAVLSHKNGTSIELTINDTKYIPLYLLKDTIVKLVFKEDKEDKKVKVIIFFKKLKEKVITHDFDTFVITDGMIRMIKKK